MTAARTPGKKKSRVARLAARLFGTRRPFDTNKPQTTDKCSHCDRACKATRAAAMELTAGAAGRFADGLGKAEGEFSAEACHCEQLTTIYRELWDNDDCTDADVGIGLSVALPTYRDRVLPADTSSIRDKEMPILVLPLPGEAHLMSAVLAARSIESTGRRVEFRVPVSVDEMQVLVKQRRFAGVVMVTSTVFSRSSRRRFIESCGEALRNASESPLRVVLYGRIAEELCEDVVAGIDAAVPEAAQLAAEFEPKISRIH